jgi:transposase
VDRPGTDRAQGDPAMKILAIDMGWFNSVSCFLDTGLRKASYRRMKTSSEVFRTLILEKAPDCVVIEAGPMAGWVRDLCDGMKMRLIVLNTNDERWCWRNVKKKTDRKDALKLAKIVAYEEDIDEVHVPEQAVRQWRQLITYRETLMNRIVSIKNRLRAILLQMERYLPAGAKAWEGKEYEQLQALARDLKDCEDQDMWRGIVAMELKRMEELQKLRTEVEDRLNRIAREKEPVQRLMEASGVGIRTAEVVVSLIDHAERFGRGREVGCYAGFTPRKFQSGKMDRDGRISRAGNGLLRKYLVQAAWAGKRSDPRMQAIYQRVRRKSSKRNKQAIVAVARHLLVWLWAMLRDGTHWRGAVAAQAA